MRGWRSWDVHDYDAGCMIIHYRCTSHRSHLRTHLSHPSHLLHLSHPSATVRRVIPPGVATTSRIPIDIRRFPWITPLVADYAFEYAKAGDFFAGDPRDAR